LNKAGEEIFNALWKEPFPIFLKNCTLAAIYRKRSGTDATLPNSVWTYFFNEMNSIDWTPVPEVKKISRWLKTYKDFPIVGIRVFYSISAPPSAVAEMTVSSTASKSQKLLEEIGPNTIIVHRRHKDPIPGLFKLDSVFLIARKNLENGSTIIIYRSVDHPNAEPLRGVKRLIFHSVAILVSPSLTLKGGTDLIKMYVGGVQNGSKFGSSPNFLLWVLTKREKDFRKLCEKTHQKNMNKTEKK